MTRTVTDKQGNENCGMDDGERTKEGEWGCRWANNGSGGQREGQGVRKGDLGEGGGVIQRRVKVGKDQREHTKKGWWTAGGKE